MFECAVSGAVGNGRAEGAEVFRGRAAGDLATGVDHEGIARLLVTSANVPANGIGVGTEDGTDWIEVAGQNDPRPHRRANLPQIHHVIHIEDIHAQRGDARQEMGDVAADVEPDVRAHVLDAAGETWFAHEDRQPCEVIKVWPSESGEIGAEWRMKLC